MQIKIRKRFRFRSSCSRPGGRVCGSMGSLFRFSVVFFFLFFRFVWFFFLPGTNFLIIPRICRGGGDGRKVCALYNVRRRVYIINSVVMAIGWRCGDMAGTTSAGEEMKNNKVVARGEEKLYISAANSKRLYIFPIRRRRPFSSRRKKKMTPRPQRSRLTTIPRLFYSYVVVLSMSISRKCFAYLKCIPVYGAWLSS